MEREIQDLKELPLSDLIANPINAVISAQASAAMTTANFIEQVGFENKDASHADRSIFDLLSGTSPSPNPDTFRMRVAEIGFEKQRKKEDGTWEQVTEKVRLPYISLFNIPNFEINRLNWSFNVRLKRVEALETQLTHSSQVGTTLDAGLSLQRRGLRVGGSLHVETASKTDFSLRYGLGREHEYNLQIAVEASSGPPPKGIDRLLAIAERVAAADETRTSES